jgi:5-aminolevulinate synthase
MDAVLRQSKSMCPFLKTTSPATLRALSTSATHSHASPGGGTMSNLQVIARRCPIMGKALAVQTAKDGRMRIGGAAAIGAIRTYSGKVSSGKAKLHTSRSHEARPLEGSLFVNDKGTCTIAPGET